MLFKSKENECLLQVLELLSKKSLTYGSLYKECQKSHTTLQRVLKYLVEKKFVVKGESRYEISVTGVRLSVTLKELSVMM